LGLWRKYGCKIILLLEFCILKTPYLGVGEQLGLWRKYGCKTIRRVTLRTFGALEEVWLQNNITFGVLYPKDTVSRSLRTVVCCMYPKKKKELREFCNIKPYGFM
jgi:hypothetical protein